MRLVSVFREGEVECEPFASEPQFRQAVEAICKLPEQVALSPYPSPGGRGEEVENRPAK